jgi:hypothetical protein
MVGIRFGVRGRYGKRARLGPPPQVLRSGAERARDYMCDVVSVVPPMVVSVGAGVVSVVVVVVVVVSAGAAASSFLAQPVVVNVRATSASDESAISFRILCVHLLRSVAAPERDHVEY